MVESLLLYSQRTRKTSSWWVHTNTQYYPLCNDCICSFFFCYLFDNTAKLALQKTIEQNPCIINFWMHFILVAELVSSSCECLGCSLGCCLCSGNHRCHSESHTVGRIQSVCPLQPACQHDLLQHHKWMPLWPHTHLCESVNIQSDGT